MKKCCKNCQNWNDASAECAVAERAIANKWNIPSDVDVALELESASTQNACQHYIPS
jgi:hypothetical protein